MKILIAVDMEGISGVVHWDHVDPKHPDYPRFRRLMTADVNAAIRGATEAGASEILVTDGHHHGRNILIEELDARARLISGTPSPLAMVEGAQSGVQAAMFIGYHARSGAQNAILEHTWSDERVANLWINGELFGETGINAAVCGQYDVPLIMVSGDKAVCAEALNQIGPVETAVVKQANGRMSAQLLPVELAQQKICEAAFNAVMRLKAGNVPPPFRPSAPVHLVLELIQSEMADKAMIMPGARRGKDRQVEYTAEDMLTAYRAFRTLLALAWD